MPDAPEPQPVDARRGAHTLGPHVVGRRIVVRRVLPGVTGPSGGPAMTDVLGVCTSWSGGVVEVASDRGPVRIAVGDIVSGKPVPPRPSVRMRTSARAAELHSLGLWPGLEVERLGEWVLRSQPVPVGRLLKRANSCLAIGDPGMSLPEASERVVGFYTARERAVLAQVEADSSLEADLTALGWRPLGLGDSAFLVAPLARVARRCHPLAVDDLATHDTRDADRFGVEIRTPAGEVVARGEAGLDGDWLGVHAMHVAESHRRRGLATRVLAALLEAGAEQGATTAWLHVETDNAPARWLYEGVGFEEHHANRYLTWAS